jgi:hypothetical protein
MHVQMQAIPAGLMLHPPTMVAAASLRPAGHAGRTINTHAGTHLQQGNVGEMNHGTTNVRI